ncbi:MAG: helix-turn-helix transcriptional regulator [Lachnospiraceae bacterium]|nr:helix-turn-helix transcriptional regulator [Lachnospiraceae bacterium]
MRDTDVIARVEALRAERNWSVYELAKEAELPYSTLNNLLHRTNIPTLPTLQRICDAYGISFAEFFTDEGTDFGITLDQEDLLRLDRDLNRQNRAYLRVYAEGLLKAQQ